MAYQKTYRQNGNSASTMREQEDAWRDQSHITTSCALCNWTYEGTALEGRERARLHRRKNHPEITPVRRRRSSLQRHGHKQEEFRTEGLANAREVADMLRRRDEDAA